MSEQLKLGQIITTPQERDAIHIAVVPVVAARFLVPGQPVCIGDDGKAYPSGWKGEEVGVVDPFLMMPTVNIGEQFWLFLNPGSITSLRHDWTHPAFPSTGPAPTVGSKSASEAWMRNWAKEHMGTDYYGDCDRLSDERAYANAIDAGHRLSVGPYESARDYIDNEWWTHWETITGERGQRGEYFSCGC